MTQHGATPQYSAAPQQGMTLQHGAAPQHGMPPQYSYVSQHDTIPLETVDLARRRDRLAAQFAEMQWDLGGLLYEMAIRNHIRIELLVARAAALQEVDAELGEVERILRMERDASAGVCPSCQAPHSSGAAYCWQCGQPLLEQVPSHAIGV